MEDNLVFLLNKLSYEIVSQDLDKEKNSHPKRKDERFFRKCMQKLRQKGCDVLLKKSTEPLLQDPCVTDYGGNWSPVTLITDYGRELKAKGVGKCHDVILSSIKTLDEKQYNCLNELLKLLLLLKRPFVESSHYQQDISFSKTDILQNSMDSFSLLIEDYSNDRLSRKSSYKKALQYEESWTKHFDSKFQVLGELSKKNLLTPDKVSLDSIFTAKHSLNRSQSRSNSFVFTDFFSGKNCRSDKNLFNLNNDAYVSENFLLDSFVDNPITHKLPSLSFSEKHFLKNGCFAKSSDQIKRKLHLLPEDANLNDTYYKETACSQETDKRKSTKSSEIELKRNSNCSHSFSILYEKSINSKSQESSLCGNESSVFLKGKKKESARNTSHTSHVSSKEIILGLWEQEQALIKEFRPELSVNFPALRMIPLADYVEDVKYLLTGINSGTFQYSVNKKCFNMEYGTCLDDVTPESLYHFSKEFLDIGNYYVKLSTVASNVGKNNSDTCTTISQAFWKSIFDFLELHYTVVLEIPLSTNLMALKASTKDLHDMITTVAEVCKVSKPEESLPQGGELLTYLLQIAEKLNKKCVINIVFGILQNCCSVYFMCILQTWMFKGFLDKQSNEFFVDYRRQKMKTRSRSYYNSFFIASEKIPSFLRGYEESIFNCGKSIHFLKLFKSEDKLCQLLEKADYPKMYLCLSDDQLEKLEKKFNEYKNRVIEFCGESVSIKDLRNEEKEQEKCYLEYVKECKKIQQQQRELMRLKGLEEAKAKKELQNKLLNEQKSFIAAEKERKKLEEEEERKKFEEVCKKVAEKKAKALNEEKTFIKNYYDDLLKSLEKQLNVTEMRKQNLLKLLANEVSNETETNEILDVINENKVEATSMEITEDLDINSNAATIELEVRTEELSNSITSEEPKELEKKAETVVLDENSNPSSTLDENNLKNQSDMNLQIVVDKTENKGEVKEKIRKSSSYRTVASEEAAKNKCRVLKSEFGLGVDKIPEVSVEPQKKNSLSDLEKNRKKVLESEYNILKNGSDHISVRSAHSKMEISKENSMAVENSMPKTETQSLKEAVSFGIVELERKVECTDLENPPAIKKSESEITKSDSSSSFFTPSNEIPSEENVSCSEPVEAEVEATAILPGNTESNSTLINPNYQNALERDTEIFLRKLSYKDIFCTLDEKETENTPNIDFMKFQRFLKKSALIPLKIQEKLANDALLKHLLVGEKLLSHLKSLRGYFFLNDGEFGRSFTYNTFRSLAKCTEPQQFFERSNLSNIVNEALNYTIHNCEPNSQNLSFQIVKMPPFLNHSSHDVLSPFELSYKVEWPLNIILTEKALVRYKRIFRFLLKLKRINWTLNENFLLLNSHFKKKRLNGKVLVGSAHYHKIQIYRHAMTQVMITLDDYIFSNGIQFPWIYFLKDLETTENIDHLYQKHANYIKDVVTRCFLSKNSQDLLDCIHNLIELALRFHYTAKSSVFEIVDGKYEHPKYEALKTTFNEFCLVIKTFLKTLKEKISTNQVISSHYVLIEKFDLKLA